MVKFAKLLFLMMLFSLFVLPVEAQFTLPGKDDGTTMDNVFIFSSELAKFCDIESSDGEDKVNMSDCMGKIIILHRTPEGRERAEKTFLKALHQMSGGYVEESIQIKKAAADVDDEIDRASLLLDDDAGKMEIELAKKNPKNALQSVREKQEVLTRLDGLVMNKLTDITKTYASQAVLNVFKDFGEYELSSNSVPYTKVENSN